MDEACKSNGQVPVAILVLDSGGRASNAKASYPLVRDNGWKRPLIPDPNAVPHGAALKGRDPRGPVAGGGAFVPSASWWGNGPPRLTARWTERLVTRTGTETLPRLLREAAVEAHLQWAKA